MLSTSWQLRTLADRNQLQVQLSGDRNKWAALLSEVSISKTVTINLDS